MASGVSPCVQHHIHPPLLLLAVQVQKEYVGIADYVQVKVFGFETALTSGAGARQARACILHDLYCPVAPPGVERSNRRVASPG